MSGAKHTDRRKMVKSSPQTTASRDDGFQPSNFNRAERPASTS
jgi:hypothetical protein